MTYPLFSAACKAWHRSYYKLPKEREEIHCLASEFVGKFYL